MGKHTKPSKKTEDQPKSDQVDSDVEGFSKWLRSDEGIENLKLFILGNTLIIFFVLAWPNIQETLNSLYYLYIEYTET